MKRGRLFTGIAAATLVMGLAVSGCGKKGDPLPPPVKLPMVISDLNAAFVPSGVELRWSVPVMGGIIGDFKILR